MPRRSAPSAASPIAFQKASSCGLLTTDARGSTSSDRPDSRIIRAAKAWMVEIHASPNPSVTSRTRSAETGAPGAYRSSRTRRSMRSRISLAAASV